MENSEVDFAEALIHIKKGGRARCVDPAWHDISLFLTEGGKLCYKRERSSTYQFFGNDYRSYRRQKWKLIK